MVRTSRLSQPPDHTLQQRVDPVNWDQSGCICSMLNSGSILVFDSSSDDEAHLRNDNMHDYLGQEHSDQDGRIRHLGFVKLAAESTNTLDRQCVNLLDCLSHG